MGINDLCGLMDILSWILSISYDSHQIVLAGGRYFIEIVIVLASGSFFILCFDLYIYRSVCVCIRCAVILLFW